jgi:hypothetical protein
MSSQPGHSYVTRTVIEPTNEQRDVPVGAAATPPPAAELYQQTIKRLSETANRGEQVAAIVDLMRIVDQALTNGGRIAALVARYPPVEVVEKLWLAAPKPLAGDKFSYVQRALEGKGNAGSNRSPVRAIRSEADLDEWDRYKAGGALGAAPAERRTP